MTNKQNADASESFRQLMAAYSKAFSSTPDSVKEEENADDTATTLEKDTMTYIAKALADKDN